MESNNWIYSVDSFLIFCFPCLGKLGEDKSLQLCDRGFNYMFNPTK